MQPCGEVQIIQEDRPLRTPRDAYGDRAPLRKHPLNDLASFSKPSDSKLPLCEDDDNNSDDSFENQLSAEERRLHRSALDSCCGCDVIDESTSSDDERFVCDSEFQTGRFCKRTRKLACSQSTDSGTDNNPLANRPHRNERWRKNWVSGYTEQSLRVSRAFLPYWVYRMYDSYSLAERLAGNIYTHEFLC